MTGEALLSIAVGVAVAVFLGVMFYGGWDQR